MNNKVQFIILAVLKMWSSVQKGCICALGACSQGLDWQNNENHNHIWGRIANGKHTHTYAAALKPDVLSAASAVLSRTTAAAGALSPWLSTRSLLLIEIWILIFFLYEKALNALSLLLLIFYAAAHTNADTFSHTAEQRVAPLLHAPPQLSARLLIELVNLLCAALETYAFEALREGLEANFGEMYENPSLHTKPN